MKYKNKSAEPPLIIQIIILLFAFSFIIISGACSKSIKKDLDDTTDTGIPVKVAIASVADVPFYLDGIGHLQAFNTVNITPQVTGKIVEVLLTEGSLVKQGDLLYLIDRRPFEADLLKALGNLAMDQASLTLAQKKVERYSDLVKKEYYAAVNYDELVQNVKLYEGAVQRDRGDIATAKLNLEYSQIRTPINGFIGIKSVDIGNIAVANSPNALVTILQSDPIYAEFTVSERYLNEIRQYQAIKPLKVEIYFQNIPTPSLIGELTIINNKIEVTTGMIRLRATVANEKYVGWPAQFITAKILLKMLENSVVIPESTIQIAQNKEFVFVVNPDMTVESRTVQRGIRFGVYYVITQGLEAGEKVVTEGQLNLSAGVKVSIKEDEPEKTSNR